MSSGNEIDREKEYGPADEKVIDQNQSTDNISAQQDANSGEDPYDVETQIDRIVSRGEDVLPPENRSSTPVNDPFLVAIDENGPEDPYNWGLPKKLFAVVQLSILALTGSAASAILAPAQNAIAAEFGVAEELTVLTVSLYVAAFVLGPLIWAPVCPLISFR